MKATFTLLPTGIIPTNERMTRFRTVGELKLDLYDADSDVIVEINVPEGFTTDFASVPRPFRWLVPTMGRYSWSAVVHDYLLTEGHNRTFCRMVMGKCMEADNVRKWRRNVILFGIRMWDYIVEARET